ERALRWKPRSGNGRSQEFFRPRRNHSLCEHGTDAKRLGWFERQAQSRTEQCRLHEVVVTRITAAVLDRYTLSDGPSIETVDFADVALAVAHSGERERVASLIFLSAIRPRQVVAVNAFTLREEGTGNDPRRQVPLTHCGTHIPVASSHGRANRHVGNASGKRVAGEEMTGGKRTRRQQVDFAAERQVSKERRDRGGR